MVRIAIAALVVLGVMGLAYMAVDTYTEAVRAEAYSDGVNDTNAEALRLAAKKQIADQEKIDKIALDAEAEIASRTATNVEKAIADVRKTNPACSLTVPRTVLDQLRTNR